jgi:hypothetical protein
VAADDRGIDDPVAARRERSRTALVARFPDLAPLLGAPLLVDPVVADGVVVDLALGGGRFYGGDGRELALRQIEDDLARPLRFLPDFTVANPTAGMVERRMRGALLEESRRLGLAPADFASQPDPDHGMLVVLGVGLGHHLAPLVARTRASHVLVVESEAEFLRQSLGAIEWQALLETVEADGGVLRLFFGQSAGPILTALRQTLGMIGLPYLDGAWFYRHYRNPVLDATARRLTETARLAFLARGYYEDERLMISNAAANLAHRSFRLIDTRPKPARREPAIIIGSGPSLDAAIGDIRRLREGAVVFSCGTALGLCRRHGIVPDYHCESENSADSHRLLSGIAAEGGLSGITLLSSVTVDPRVPPLFDQTFFCFREMSISTRLLAAPDQEIGFAAPIVGNLALRLAAALGFQTVYLFGLDCGARSVARKHARGSVYEAHEDLRQREQALRYDLTVPGNFGGTILTDPLFNWSRIRYQAFIAASGLTVFNCSDGARIEGAKPLVPRSVRFPHGVLDRARIQAAIAQAHVRYPPGAFLDGRSLAPARAEARRFFADLDAALAAAAAGDADLFGVWRRLAPFAGEAPAGYGGVTTIAFGSLRYLARIGGTVLRRVPDEGLRRQMLTRYLAEFRAIMTDLCGGTLSLLDELSEHYLPPKENQPPKEIGT